jgi:putative glutamine amidotransferase
MKPIIGLTPEFVPNNQHGQPWHAHHLLINYTTAIRLAGGIPIMLPLAHPDIAPQLLDRIDGIILTGGREDVPPEAYSQDPHAATIPMSSERWENEKNWLACALEAEKPILGICLGMQVINVALGGSLLQDIPSQREQSEVHADPSRMHQHNVTLTPGSWLASVAPATTTPITSAHHQAMDVLAPGLIPTAHSDDGIVEAIEAPERGILAAVQWHPERNLIQPDWLLQAFVHHCAAPLPTSARR